MNSPPNAEVHVTNAHTHSSSGDDRSAPAASRIRRAIRRLLRWVEHLLATFAALLILVTLSPLPSWLYYHLDRQTQLRPADYIICLGGHPNRIIESARLLKEGYAPKLIVSNNQAAAPVMRSMAIDWGAPADRVMMDTGSYVTSDHPRSVEKTCGVDPAKDTVIIVTSFAHMARARACFVKAGYKNIIMREPRWERQFRPHDGVKRNFWIMPELLYEVAALTEYWVTGRI
jgi:uncharacterized SAM-binding protein YcdF (DUF218 family)